MGGQARFGWWRSRTAPVGSRAVASKRTQRCSFCRLAYFRTNLPTNAIAESAVCLDPRPRHQSEEYAMDRFVGRSAIVTGAASGIGAAIATALAGEGARVVAVDYDLRVTAAAADYDGLAVVAT